MSDDVEVSVEEMVKTYAELKGRKEWSDDPNRGRWVRMRWRLAEELRARGVDPDTIKAERDEEP